MGYDGKTICRVKNIFTSNMPQILRLFETSKELLYYFSKKQLHKFDCVRKLSLYMYINVQFILFFTKIVCYFGNNNVIFLKN